MQRKPQNEIDLCRPYSSHTNWYTRGDRRQVLYLTAFESASSIDTGMFVLFVK